MAVGIELTIRGLAVLTSRTGGAGEPMALWFCSFVLHVYVCVHGGDSQVYADSCACVYMHMEPKVDVRSFSRSLSTLLLDTQYFTEPGAHQSCLLVNSPEGVSVSVSLNAGITSGHHICLVLTWGKCFIQLAISPTCSFQSVCVCVSVSTCLCTHKVWYMHVYTFMCVCRSTHICAACVHACMQTRGIFFLLSISFFETVFH